MLVGNKKFIDESRFYRKMLGGGMRQVGVLAAAGLIALEKMPWRLHEDHENAALLAKGLAAMSGIRIDPEKVHTNILVFDIGDTGMNPAEFSEALKQRGVLGVGISNREMRFVTHYDVSRSDCETALRVVESVLNA